MTEKERKPYPENDPVTEFLRNAGYEVSSYFMGSTSLLLGARFEYHGFEIVYRVKEDTIIMIIYRRLNKSANSLKNSFEPFVWFAERLIYDIPEIKFMRGKPDPLPAKKAGKTRKDSHLNVKKLLRFYCDIMGAEPRP